MEIPECSVCKSKEWVPCEPYCEDCGNHSGYRCSGCDEIVDAVWNDKLFDQIEDIIKAHYG